MIFDIGSVKRLQVRLHIYIHTYNETAYYMDKNYDVTFKFDKCNIPGLGIYLIEAINIHYL